MLTQAMIGCMQALLQDKQQYINAPHTGKRWSIRPGPKWQHGMVTACPPSLLPSRSHSRFCTSIAFPPAQHSTNCSSYSQHREQAQHGTCTEPAQGVECFCQVSDFLIHSRSHMCMLMRQQASCRQMPMLPPAAAFQHVSRMSWHGQSALEYAQVQRKTAEQYVSKTHL
jgi:hypothetical protein